MLPTGPTVSIDVKDKFPAAADAVAVFVTEGATEALGAAELLSEAEQLAVSRLVRSQVARGKAREVHFDIVESPSTPRAKVPGYRRVLVVGLGPLGKVNAEIVRQAAAALARASKKLRLSTVSILLPTLGVNPDTMAEAVVTGLLLAAYDYEEYKGTASRKKPADDLSPFGKTFTLVAESAGFVEAKRGAARGRAIADGQNFARTIASRPGNDINPPTLAKVAQELAREVGLTCRVLDEKQMAKLGMGGILAVGVGSATPPRLIALEWDGGNQGEGGRRKADKKSGSKAASSFSLPPSSLRQSPLLVVGKAITFDTGGISIKTADKMGRMIFDKCGGMAVLGLMYAVAKLNLPTRVVGLLSSAENHISGEAYRPGDILRMYNGVTVEVTNTDAEGRLVLGDALAWGIETYKPSAVVDLATLTGGVVVALGKTMAGVMSNDDGLVAELQQAADAAGEKFWRLPVGDEQREYIKSVPADIVNSGGREGHPLQGGAFLSFFVPPVGSKDFIPWAHLDIAGVADTEKDLPLYAKGATGWGVRTLVEWVTSKSAAPKASKAVPLPAGG